MCISSLREWVFGMRFAGLQVRWGVVEKEAEVRRLRGGSLCFSPTEHTCKGCLLLPRWNTRFTMISNRFEIQDHMSLFCCSDVLRFLLRVRCWEYRHLPGIYRLNHPSRPDKVFHTQMTLLVYWSFAPYIVRLLTPAAQDRDSLFLVRREVTLPFPSFERSSARSHEYIRYAVELICCPVRPLQHPGPSHGLQGKARLCNLPRARAPWWSQAPGIKGEWA